MRSTRMPRARDDRVVLRRRALPSSQYRMPEFDSEQRQTGVRAATRLLGPGVCVSSAPAPRC